MNTAKRLISGSSLRFITLICSILISIVMMPFIIHQLGDKLYGVWIVIASVLGFYGLFDLGISSATQRFIAYALGKKNESHARNVFVTSFYLFVLVGLISLIITLVIAFFGDYFFELQGETNSFRTAVIIMGVSMAIGFPFMVLYGVLTAYLRYDMVSYVQLGKTIIRPLLMAYALLSGYGIVGMACVTLIADVGASLILFVLTKKVAPWVSVHFRYITRSEINALVSFGKFSLLASFGDKLKNNSDSIIISSIISVSAITPYQIAYQICNYFFQIMISLVGVMTPVFTRLYASEEHEELNKQFLYSTRVAALIGAPIVGGIVCFGDALISLWIGEGYENVYPLMLILIAGLLFNGIQIPSIHALYAVEKHKYYAYLNFFEAAINISVSITLVKVFALGLTGIAIGTLISLVLSKIIIQPIIITRVLKINLVTYYVTLLKPLILISLPTALFLLIQNTYFVNLNIFEFITGGVLYLMCIFLFSWLLILESKEKELVFRLVKKRNS